MTAVFESVAARSEALGTDLVISKPSGTVDGDGLIFIGVCGVGQTISKPDASWATASFSLGGGGPCFYKYASSEPDSWTFAVSGSVSSVGQVIRVSGQALASFIEAGAGNYVAGSGGLAIPSVTALGPNRLFLQAVCKLNNTTFTDSAGIEQWDATTPSQSVVYAGGSEVVQDGATGTRTWTPAAGSGPFIAYGILIKGLELDGDTDFVFSTSGDIAVSNSLDAEPDFVFSHVADIVVESALDVTGTRSFLLDVDAELEVSGGGTGSLIEIARYRAAFYLGLEEPELSAIDTGWLLREYWGRKAGLVGDLSTYSTYDIISVYFPGSHFIRDVE